MTPEQKREDEANRFAMALLMPSEMLKAEVKKLSGVTYENAVKILAKKFDVSRERMAARLEQLKLLT